MKPLRSPPFASHRLPLPADAGATRKTAMSDFKEKCQRCGVPLEEHRFEKAKSGYCCFHFICEADAIEQNELFAEEKTHLAELLGKARCEQREAERQRDAMLEAIDQYRRPSIFTTDALGKKSIARIALDKIEQIRAEIEASKPK